MSAARPRRRILTWHVHGNYMYYLSQVPHDFYLVADDARSSAHGGRCGALPWGPNVHEVHVDAVARTPFDLVLYQNRAAWEDDRHRLLSPAQQRLPTVYLEHDPPQQHPTDTPHWCDTPDAVLVHVTHFNALMWNAGRTPTRVIEHGVKLLQPARYTGELARGLVVINQLGRRGRRLGLDIYQAMARQVPLQLVGMDSRAVGGAGEVPQQLLPQQMARHRFFFHPVRYTSLGLALIEAMMIGQPVVSLATTEAAAVLRDGETAIVDTRPARLLEGMRMLLRDPQAAHALGQAGQRMAVERFHIERFVHDWDRLIGELCA